MAEIFLDVEPRQESGKSKVKDLRDQGFIPGVVYGGAKLTQPIKIGHKQLLQLIHQHRLESVVINLRIAEEKKQKPRPCIIKELQYDPVTGDVLHVDFNEISLTKLIRVNVPIIATGQPLGVKQEGGTLEHIMWEVEVECLPTEIPREIQVDVSQLKIGDAIHVRDIAFSNQVKVLADPEASVLSVTAAVKEEVAPPLEGEEKLEPEVIKEKKEMPAEGEEPEAKPQKAQKQEEK